MILMITLAIMTMVIVMSESPVKITYWLMLSSVLTFFLCYLQSGSPWYPLTFFLIFMGGVLIMFLMLSSLLPNQSMGKKYISKVIVTLMICTTIINWIDCSAPLTMGIGPSSGKMFFTQGANMMLMMVLILTYFLTFVALILSEGTSLHVSECSNSNSFVNSS